jgi:hypothetical protein
MICAIHARKSTEQNNVSEKAVKWGTIIVLTTLVAAASTNLLADCGWILWHELQVMAGRDSSEKEWSVAGSAKSFDQCAELQEKTLADHFKRLKSKNDSASDGAEEHILRGGPMIVVPLKSGRMEIRYSCWPESKDPRH